MKRERGKARKDDCWLRALVVVAALAATGRSKTTALGGR
jgi:hypothetical protein